MQRALTLISIQHQLSMHIGLDLRLAPMLEQFMKACIQRLSLRGCHLYLTASIDRIIAAEPGQRPLAEGPRPYLNIPEGDATAPHRIECLAPLLAPREIVTMEASRTRCCDGRHFHLFRLGDLGAIVLERNGDPLSDEIVSALQPIMERLALSCRASLEHERSLHEIALRKRTEQALRNSQSRLTTMFENVVDGIICIDRYGMVESVNRAVVKMLGYEKEELVGANIDRLIPQRYKQAHATSLRRYRESGVAHVVGKPAVELAALHKEGHEIPVELTLREMQLDGTLHFIGILRDLSQRKRHEQELARSQQHTANLLEHTHDVFLLVDDQSRIQYANNSAERLFGLRREQLIGRTLSETLPGLAHHLGDILQRARESKRPDGEEKLYPMLGRWFESRAFATTDGIGIYLHDVTESKEAAEAMQKARDAALAASRAKSEFLANMSHEVRTPMNGVIGMLELLIETDLDEEQREYAEMALQSGEMLLELLNDILDLSKVEAGKLALERIDIHLPSFLEETLTILARTARSKGLELDLHIAEGVPKKIVGDPTRLAQVLINLVNNAIKFTEQGGVRVEVDWNGQRHEVLFKVIDTGIGIADEARERIFEIFTQADGSTTRKYGGTGLGLAICRHLIHAMGGEIGVETRPGQGSCFHFTLPQPEAA